LNEREPLIELGVDGKITEMHLVTMPVILIWLNLNGEYCYKTEVQSTT
jgi:hypothetical protein